ncbi:MAG: hypothetical protein JWO58_3399 [Chitinophagaceae bacterium]|nr:hypothetical protein [Chitinophagaceae bacterium]
MTHGTQGALGFGDDVVGDSSSPRAKSTKNRSVDDIGSDGMGDQDSFHDGPQGILGFLSTHGYLDYE